MTTEQIEELPSVMEANYCDFRDRIRADLIQAIDESMTNLLLVCESSDNDDVILVADAAGNRYKLTITELPPV
jgi:hypothetical protein